MKAVGRATRGANRMTPEACEGRQPTAPPLLRSSVWTRSLCPLRYLVAARAAPTSEPSKGESGTRVLIRHEGRPIQTYAVMLQVRRRRKWITIRLIDNAHGEHHMHRFDGTTKLGPVPFMAGKTEDVIPEAIGYMLKAWRSIIEGWETR